MNSIVGPIFNIFFFLNKVVVGPVNSDEQCVNSDFCLLKKLKRVRRKKRKKEKEREKRGTQNTNANNSNPNTHYGSVWIELIVVETENIVVK